MLQPVSSPRWSTTAVNSHLLKGILLLAQLFTKDLHLPQGKVQLVCHLHQAQLRLCVAELLLLQCTHIHPKLYSVQPGVNGTNYIWYGDTRGTVLPSDNLLKHTRILTPIPYTASQHIPYTHPNTSLTHIQTHPLHTSHTSKHIPYACPNRSHTHIQTHPLHTSDTHIHTHTSQTVQHTAWCLWNKLHLIQ